MIKTDQLHKRYMHGLNVNFRLWLSAHCQLHCAHILASPSKWQILSLRAQVCGVTPTLTWVKAILRRVKTVWTQHTPLVALFPTQRPCRLSRPDQQGTHWAILHSPWLRPRVGRANGRRMLSVSHTRHDWRSGYSPGLDHG